MKTRASILMFLFALALAWSGCAAQLHALAHAQHDLATTVTGEKVPAVPGENAPAPVKHATDQCLVMHALDGATAEGTVLLEFESASRRCVLFTAEIHTGSFPAAYRSRAPPALA